MRLLIFVLLAFFLSTPTFAWNLNEEIASGGRNNRSPLEGYIEGLNQAQQYQMRQQQMRMMEQ
jgi:hypothetical protein